MFKQYDETKRKTLVNLYKYMQRVAASRKPTAKDKTQKHNWRTELRRTGLLSLPFSLNPKRWQSTQLIELVPFKKGNTVTLKVKGK